MTDHESTARLFLAVEPTAEMVAELRAVQRALETLQPGAWRFVPPHQLHLTMAFFERQPRQDLLKLINVLCTSLAGIRPFRLALDAIGHFGGRAPRVAWVGVRSPDGALDTVRTTVADALKAAKIAFDDRPFRPHFTLARSRSAVARAAPVPSSPPLRWASIDQLTLFESQLSNKGATHSIVQAFGLEGRAPGCRSQGRNDD
ncbi:MAG: RNA 2',3'-cyclic phosphodiesterase [Chloroflexota bacterium]